MKCSKCGFENQPEMQFCGKCGAKLAQPCPHCGFENPPEHVFCGKCGKRLEKAVVEVVPPKLEDMQDRLYIPKPLAERMSVAAKEMKGENRLVTALFADISGFTPLSTQHSPEKVVEVVNDCFKAIVDVILSYEGSINRFIGDCVLAFFGAPIIHENDPERAILAALQMREEVAKLSLDISVGINSGMMYFGEIGTEQHVEYSAYGPDINLAKRLQESAKPGSIFVGVGTYRHTRRAFDFNLIEGLTVKGITQPVTAYEVLNVKERPEKLRGLEGLRARMIGREREFTDLKEAADELLAGHGQMVSIIGEAGIGKSRLATELKEYLKDKEVQLYEGRCISIGQQISYWPFLDILRNYFDLRKEDTEKERGEKIIKAMNKLFHQRAEEFIPFIGNLMSVKFGDDYDEKLRYLTAEQIRHLTLMRLNDTFVAMARENPLLLVLEDFHWADDLSLDLVSLLMDELASSPLMLLCIYRPEKEHRSFQMGQMASRKCPDLYAEITLKNLSTRESRQLVESLLAIENLPSKVKEMILQKSEGNPFFIEEVVRSLIASDIIYREGDRWKARESIESISVPDTVQGVILSRVDKLHSEVKYVLQCASVIGRIFRYRLLGYLAQQERELDRRLEELEEKELVYEERSVPELEYAFRHVLTQEATYGGILERQRLMFHHQVGEGIEALYRERLDEYYEELAYHYSKSPDKEKALEYLIKAGKKSAGRYANREALDYYTRALELIETLDEEKAEELAEIHEGLGDVRRRVGYYTEAIADYESALQWREEPRQRAELYRKIGWIHTEDMQEKQTALSYFDRALEELGESDTSVEKARVYRDATWAARTVGAGMATALSLCMKGIELAEAKGYQRELSTLYVYGWYLQGAASEETDLGQRGLEISEQLGDIPSLAWNHFVIGHGFQWRNNDEKGIKHLSQAIQLAEQVGDMWIIALSSLSLSQAYRGKGDLENALTSAQRSLSLSKEFKYPHTFYGASRAIAGLYEKQGEIDKLTHLFVETLDYAALLRISPKLESNCSGHLSDCWGNLRRAYQRMNRGEELLPLLKRLWKERIKAQPIRPLRLWYLERLTEECMEQGNREEAAIFAQEMADGYQQTAGDYLWGLVRNLGALEELYEKIGIRAEFVLFCEKLRQERAEELQKFKLTQLYLEPKELSGRFTQTIFSDEFDQSALNPRWQWINPRGDCSYDLTSKPSWLEIRAASGCDLWVGRQLHAPRLLLETSGEFAIETKIASVSEDIPTVGGLLVWKDEHNYIRFERGMHAENEISLSGNVRGKWGRFGRGMLVSEIIYLRMERIGDTFSAYCSSDGSNWMTCGEVSFPAEDPIQVGIHVIGGVGMRGRDMDTATRFDYFKVLRES